MKMYAGLKGESWKSRRTADSFPVLLIGGRMKTGRTGLLWMWTRNFFINIFLKCFVKRGELE